MSNDELVSKARKEIHNNDDFMECIKIMYKLWLDVDVNESNSNKWVYLKTRCGLCDFIEEILEENSDRDKNNEIIYLHDSLLYGLKKYTIFPFGYDDYKYSCKNATQHLNHERIAWVNHVLSDEFDSSEPNNFS